MNGWSSELSAIRAVAGAVTEIGVTAALVGGELPYPKSLYWCDVSLKPDADVWLGLGAEADDAGEAPTEPCWDHCGVPTGHT